MLGREGSGGQNHPGTLKIEDGIGWGSLCPPGEVKELTLHVRFVLSLDYKVGDVSPSSLSMG